MANPIPLSAPDGTVFSFACSTCLCVASGYEHWGKRRWTTEELAELAEHCRANAASCCSCRRCKAPAPDVVQFDWHCEKCAPVVAAEAEEHRARWAAGEAAFRVRYDAALAKALDPNAAVVLRDRMSEISEDESSAGWLIGLEFDLWRRVMDGENVDLREMAIACGGWWIWSEGDGGDCGNLFVPMEDWVRLYAEHTKETGS